MTNGSRLPSMPEGALRQESCDSERPPFRPRVSSLNVLPSRQNFFWAGESPHPHGLVPSSGHLVPTHGEEVGFLLEKAESLRAALLTSEAQEAPVQRSVSDTAVDEEDQLDTREAVFNLSNTVLGVGVLSVPYAFRLSGYVCVVIVLVVIMVTARTAVFIGQALALAEKSAHAAEVPRRGRDFAFLAHVAFGDRGRVLISSVTSLEIWFALITFMVMNGFNATLLWPSLGHGRAIVLSTLLALATAFVPMRVYSYLSLVSSFALFAAAVAMVGAALTMMDWANPYQHFGLSAILRAENIPRSVGIIVFCFAGHPCFPIVHECMRDRSKWTESVTLTFILAFLYYGGLGIFGYVVFGLDLEASVTQNLAHLRGAFLWRSASALAFLVKIQLTAPLLLNAILVSFWPPQVKGPTWPAPRLAALLALAALTALTALLFADDVAAVASLTGSLFTMMTSVLFPAIVHFRLARTFGDAKEMCWRSFLPHALVVAFGTVMAIWGTALAVQDMLRRP